MLGFPKSNILRGNLFGRAQDFMIAVKPFDELANLQSRCPRQFHDFGYDFIAVIPVFVSFFD